MFTAKKQAKYVKLFVVRNQTEISQAHQPAQRLENQGPGLSSSVDNESLESSRLWVVFSLKITTPKLPSLTPHRTQLPASYGVLSALKTSSFSDTEA